MAEETQNSLYPKTFDYAYQGIASFHDGLFSAAESYLPESAAALEFGATGFAVGFDLGGIGIGYALGGPSGAVQGAVVSGFSYVGAETVRATFAEAGASIGGPVWERLAEWLELSLVALAA